MKVKSLISAIISLMFLVSYLFGSPSPAIATKTHKIMLLGDSITVGAGDYDKLGYRTFLDQYLRLAAKPNGFDYQFVGSVKTAEGLKHEGHGGWSIDEIHEEITSWQGSYLPDIILLHVGTNNISAGEKHDEVLAKLGNLLALIRSNQPNVRVFVASIIDVANSTPYDERVENYRYSRDTRDVVVQAGSGFYSVLMSNIGDIELYDYHHPNKFGYHKMAYTWFRYLKIRFGDDWDSVSTPYSLSTYNICQYNFTTKTRSCKVRSVN